MTYLFYLIVFTLGSSIVSFLTVMAHDFPKISINRRSSCDHCHKILKWYELVPILGFILTSGTCKSCLTKIPIVYPLTESLGGLFFLILLIQDKDLYIAVPITLMMILLGFMDHYYGYIYSILYLLSLPAFIYALLNHYPLHFIAGLLVYTSLLVLNRVYQNIGLGDVELLGLLAVIFGLENILKIILLACLLCILKFMTDKKRSFRFIPYLTIATGIVYLIS
ncbi:prepilin peptidase [Companilactobacillus sp. HBUAS59699]|uniref:prepilin peptidase n=1 Tax=Companilactobacillus sp. HBUAS59699 TaxID=3109358 RepID=UPI002FEF67E7